MHQKTVPRPISRVSLADQVYDRLLNEIQLGHLRSGDELSEVAVAERYSVSRTPVREALRRLSSESLVRSSGRRLCAVVRLSREETIEAFQVRRCLEEYAVRLAAERISDDEIDALCKQCRDASPGGLPDWIDREWAFDMRLHQEIAKASGNSHLQRDIQRYLNMVHLVRGISARNEDRQAAGHEEHMRLLEALKSRDPDAAARCMVEHLDRALDAILRDVDWGEEAA